MTEANPSWPALPLGLGADTRHLAHVDPDRGQGPPGAHALAQSLVAGAALREARAASPPRPFPTARESFEIEFDFLAHELRIEKSDGARTLRLAPRAVADFYADVMAAPPRARHRGEDLDHAGRDSRPRSASRRTAATPPTIRSTPALLAHPRCGRRGVQGIPRRASSASASPVHFFWGSFDLAVTRFSGRRAPPIARAPTASRARPTRTR